eukprot:gene2244-2418_t
MKKILIANRGEIACRVIKTCQKMGIRTVAVYSKADENSPHVLMAEESVYIGESESSKSYLNAEKIIKISKDLKCDGIHPGYGFLSENADFSKKCEEANIKFIGPKPQSISSIGSKMGAKILLKDHGIPLIPGYHGTDEEELKKQASKIELPILIKASAGGGGKGMRIVNDLKELNSAIDSAKTEALNSFGDDKLLVEKYFTNVRHIEVQIFGDAYGNVIHLYERECSIQRRHQKIIEESPSIAITDEIREKICNVAVKIGEVIKYENAGTVEFIFDDLTKKFYFLEVNTRLQVEHPVTENITNLDLVKLQIDIANGMSLKDYKKPKMKGHSIECRLYAEDPNNQFFPSPGRILKWKPYEIDNLRFDSGVRDNSEITVYYDPMICKIISFGSTRDEAIEKLIIGLSKTIVLGTITNKNFLIKVLKNENFKNGKFDTNFISNNLLVDKREEIDFDPCFIIATMVFDWIENNKNRKNLRFISSGFRNSPYKLQSKHYRFNNDSFEIQYEWKENNQFNVEFLKKKYDVKLFEFEDNLLNISINNIRRSYFVLKNNNQRFIHCDTFGDCLLTKYSLLDSKLNENSKDTGNLISNVPGKVWKILKKTGDQVKVGETLLIIESMKMENKKFATKDGIVTMLVKEGNLVNADTVLAKIE